MFYIGSLSTIFILTFHISFDIIICYDTFKLDLKWQQSQKFEFDVNFGMNTSIGI